MPLLQFNDSGIFCEQANVYIDPWKKVDRAIITHAHADHSRWGMKHYLAHHMSIPVMKLRLGQDISVQGIEYGEKLIINGVEFSLYPAGHIPGSAQIKVSYKGETWVVSGDYKTEADGISTPFEPVKCNTFITECTFGLPVYHWKPQEEIFNEINIWWKKNKEEGLTTFITAYSLGKAQRVIKNVDASIGKIFTHGAVENTTEALRTGGLKIPETIRVERGMDKNQFKGSLVVAPPSAINSPWMKQLKPASLGIASGWMQLRGTRRRRAADRGFALSDHADWNGLLSAIKATEAETVITTHGYTNVFSKYLNEIGIRSMEEKTLFTGESIDNTEEDKLEGEAA
ncbi:ligase-associated DNA damage response exonuclease [uncultured Roseivirga sp.]|uniref:ligase-associated DNA damage response exonuclease n=1 Tax=uncultured Roseivirga sp. TaxID=543088 RepID=UPI000D7AB5B5|nr:ligase-associated DNA damage response exonuclease [uncultured Roseivirga sp.]PWL29182.1 MAG: DNA ligase-associated DEXH box helicase [Roseivirga sp. XM-24bin3]